MVGPPAFSRFRFPWGLGLEEGEGLLGEVVLGGGLLCVVVLFMVLLVVLAM